MREYRQSLSRIIEVSETSATNSEVALPNTSYNRVIVAVPPGQFDGADSVREVAPEQISKEGRENANVIRPDTWSQKRLSVAYASIFLVLYINSLQLQISNHLLVDIMSTFGKNSLTATNGIISDIVGAVIKLPMSRVSDLWGRIELFTVVVLVTVLGLILAATAKSVVSFMVAQILCLVGYDAISYVLSVAIADLSSLRNRGLIFAVTSIPHLINTFVGPIAAQRFHKQGNWRWSYGIFAIILPLIALPLSATLFDYHRKTTDLTHNSEKSNNKVWEFTRRYLVESDVVGGVLLGGIFVALLLPFNLGVLSQTPIMAPHLSLMLAAGIFLFPAFVMWERFQCQTHIVPFRHLLNSAILGACISEATLSSSFHCLDSYFVSYLQVVHDLSISKAGYVHNTYIIGACFFAISAGILIRITGTFTRFAVMTVTFDILATALTMVTRQPNKLLWHLIMNQIMLSIPGGILGICGQMVVMKAAGHSEVATTLALSSLFAGLGSAIGKTIATAIYMHYMPKSLEKYLPLDAKPFAREIYESINQQLSYPMGSAVRQAIIQAYEDFMRQACIAGLGFMPLALLSVAMWENIDIKNKHQRSQAR